MTENVRVRFAPSPTGYLHIGGVRTALYNWLFARQQGGTFILRMEDTDRERNTEAARRTIFDGLSWLGLDPDEGPEQGGDDGPYNQSERQDLYVEWAERLKEKGGIYPCFCSRERLKELRESQEKARTDLRYDGLCRSLSADEAQGRIAAGEDHTWRLKVPEEGELVLDDLVRGRVTLRMQDVEDIILIRSNGVPVYNFAVVVDDHLMRISHVVRGEDHLTNTFKQLLIYRALGWDRPVFAHLPLILGPTGGGKLSKRKHPEAALEPYRKKGYPRDGFLNWLALVGWSYDDKTVFMTRDELIERFSFDRVNASAARLPMEKLESICGEHIRTMAIEDVAAEITPHLQAAGWIADDPGEEQTSLVRRIAEATRDRLRAFGDIVELMRWLFEDDPAWDAKALKNLQKEGAAELLRAYEPVLLAGDFDDPQALEAEARAFCESRQVGFGRLVHPVRAALTHRAQGPGLFDCAVLLGREACARRINRCLAEIGAEDG